MNRKSILKQLLLAFVLAVCCLGLGGCFAGDLSTSERSPDVRGRVVDSHSGLPVANARVAWVDQPELPGFMTTTDAKGGFHLRATHDHHLLTDGDFFYSSDYPRDKWYGHCIEITHSNYYSSKIFVYGKNDPNPLLTKPPPPVKLRDIALTHLPASHDLEIADQLFAQAKALRDTGELAGAEKASRQALNDFYVLHFNEMDYRIVESQALLNEVVKLEGKPADNNPAPTNAIAPDPFALKIIAQQMDDAATKGDLETVSNLFAAHPELIEARNAWGSTLLTDASYNGRDAVVAWLLAHGADVNTQNNMLWTPLIHAARRGHVGAVRLLLASHADASLKTNYGKTALDFAREFHWPEVEAMLTEDKPVK